MSKRVVVIHVDALRREYVSSWLLAERFRHDGYKIIMTSRGSTRLLMKVFTPDILILSHVFTLNPSELKKLANLKVRIYVNEVEGVVNNEFGISTTYPVEDIDYSWFSGIFVWSQWSRDWLIKNRGIREECVHVVGSIRNSAIQRRKNSTNVPVVGILSRFELINIFDERHNFENLISLDPECRDCYWYFERAAIDAESFSIASKIIGILTSRGVKVSMRPHPNECVKNYRILKKKFGNLFVVDESLDISEWISKVSVVLGPASTAYTEPYIAGIPIITTEQIQRNKYSDHDQKRMLAGFLRAAYAPKSVCEAIELCTNISLEPKNDLGFNDYLEEFYSIQGVPSPICKIVYIINTDLKLGVLPRYVMNYSLAKSFKILIDFARVLKALLRRHPMKSLGKIYQYDFNELLHRPNFYMRNLDRGD